MKKVRVWLDQVHSVVITGVEAVEISSDEILFCHGNKKDNECRAVFRYWTYVEVLDD